MDRLTLDQIEPWLLSGKPVVRFYGRDFSQSVDEYADWVRDIGQACNVGIAMRKLSNPPALVVQAYLGTEAPQLADPMLNVTKGQMPWLFCIFTKCRIRVKTPGMSCAAHGG